MVPLDELLRQAQAGDAAARAVYADALLAAGDPRGELIALESAGKPSARLRRLHAEHWFGLPWHCVKTVGGFPTGVAFALGGPANELIPQVDELEVVMAPMLLLPDARARRLSLQGEIQFLRSQLVDARLDLEALVVGGAIGALGGAMEGLDNLKLLGLAGARGASDLFHRMFGMDLSRIEELDLRNCGLNPYALSSLLSRPLPALRVLKLSGNPLGDQGTAILQRTLRNLPALERLELIDCNVEDVTGLAITDRADLPAQLHLMGCTIEIVPIGRERHLVLVDGEQRKVRVRTAHSQDGAPAGVIESAVADDAPLTVLYDALALGPRRIHTDAGARVWLSREVAFAYTASYTTTQLAELDLTDDVVGISLERHVEAED